MKSNVVRCAAVRLGWFSATGGILRLGVGLAMLVGASGWAANGEKAEKKLLQKQMKTLVTEAKGFEGAGQLTAARRRFTLAQSFWDSPEAQAGVNRVNEKVQKQTAASIRQAHLL